MKMSNRAYDIFKWIAMVAVPAIGTLYFALAQIWGLPFGEEIVGSISAVDTFLGVILGISSKNYKNAQAKEKDTSPVAPAAEDTMKKDPEGTGDLP